MLSINTPHSPFELPDALYKKYADKGLDTIEASVYGMMENIDQNVARVMKAVDEQGVLENTVFIYASDNGPQFPAGQKRYNGNMKGNKGTLEEGGVRVPFAVYWPGVIEGGQRIDRIAQHIDLYPTLLSLAGLELETSKKGILATQEGEKSVNPGEESSERPEIAGKDLSSLLAGYRPAAFQDRMLFSHRFRIGEGDRDWIRPSPGAVRTQRWVAVLSAQDERWRLYDIVKDPSQSQDVAASFPKALAALTQAYDTWFERTTEEYRDRYGEYGPLPIHIGHEEAPSVELPSHEGLLSGPALSYANGSGWSHDWIIGKPSLAAVNDSTSSIRWPVEVVEDGNYRLTLLYSAPSPEALGSPVRLTTTLQNATLSALGLPEFTSAVDKGLRYYDSGEAYDLSWGEIVLGEVRLAAQPPEWMHLRLETSESLDHKTRDDATDSKATLAIKGIRITRLDD